MFEQLLQYDIRLFHFINHDLTNPVFDVVMPLLHEPKFWIPLYVFIVIFCWIKFKKLGIVIVLLMAGSAGAADFTSGVIVKQMVHRLRPCQDPVVSKTDIERVGCGTHYSFPSTHAADFSAMAFFGIMIFYKRWRWIWFWGILWAGSISFAQVYVGVHYPGDVFCGALYGSFVGWLISRLFYWLQVKFPDWTPVI